MGIPKPDKIPEVIEYCTQLGVSGFVFAVCSRSQGDFDRSVSRKLDHFKKIAKSAAELSGREIIPEVSGPVSLAQALIGAKGLKLIPWELESDKTIAGAYHKSDEITVCIGPEGGLSHEEIEMAKAQGFEPVTLGKRILRAQLAPVVAISQILAFMESH
jgi:16S rRNA (uracil1498-N3)-methyltransferase